VSGFVLVFLGPDPNAFGLRRPGRGQQWLKFMMFATLGDTSQQPGSNREPIDSDVEFLLETITNGAVD